MADNYLEKRMDDYRRGVNKISSRRYHNSASTGKQIVIEPQNLLLCIADKDLNTALLHELQGNPGLKVAFLGIDRIAGSRLAQSTGGLFIPVGSFDAAEAVKAYGIVTSRWGSLGVLLTDLADICGCIDTGRKILYRSEAGQGCDSANSISEIIISGGVADCSDAARVATLLLTPQASSICSIILKH